MTYTYVTIQYRRYKEPRCMVVVPESYRQSLNTYVTSITQLQKVITGGDDVEPMKAEYSSREHSKSVRY